MSDKVRHCGFTIAAGNADDRNPAISLVGEEMLDDGFANGARRTDDRFDVHQQTGPGIDLDNRPSLFGKWTGNISGNEIDAGNIQPDDAGRK